MDAERAVDPVTDAALDREIQTALAEDPSPEFLARVRARIANEPAPSRPWLSWTLAAAAAIAAVIVMAMVLSRPRETVPSSPAGVARGGNPVEPARPKEPGPQVIPTRGPNAPAQQPAAVAQAPADRLVANEPEILIDSRESMALRRLITGTRDGSLDLSAALQTTIPTAMELPAISDVVIVPITIEPLAPPAGAEGVRP
jgi:hypothetical protein